ncbi:MAG: type II CAAX endopeptidase family protein [bacterium]|nr:type II CAAX endopeptidase family protein [bacterium]
MMNRKSTAILAVVIAAVYIWLGYAMIVLRNPLIAMFVYYPILCFGGGYIIRKSTNIETSKLFTFEKIQKPALVTFLLCVFATAVLWLCTLFFRPGMIDPSQLSSGLSSIGMTKQNYWIVGGFLVLVNPFAEEFLWRSAVLPFFMSGTKRNAAIIYSCILFAGYHPLVLSVMMSPLWLAMSFLLIFVGGIIFSNLYLRTRSLAYPIALHMLINLNFRLIGYLYTPSSTP